MTSMFSPVAVSENRGTPKSSILIGFSIINHQFWGIPILGPPHINAGFNLVLPLHFLWYFEVQTHFNQYDRDQSGLLTIKELFIGRGLPSRTSRTMILVGGMTKKNMPKDVSHHLKITFIRFKIFYNKVKS